MDQDDIHLVIGIFGISGASEFHKCITGGDSRGSLSVRVFLSGDNKSRQHIERRSKGGNSKGSTGGATVAARANHGRHDGSIIDKPNFFSTTGAAKIEKTWNGKGLLTDCGWRWGFWALGRRSEREGHTCIHEVNSQRNMCPKDEIYLSNSYARSLARVAG